MPSLANSDKQFTAEEANNRFKVPTGFPMGETVELAVTCQNNAENINELELAVTEAYENKYAVVVRNAVVDYQGFFGCCLGRSAQPVLKGLNMSVPDSKVYALLGPSGCGKTTLLKCLVGVMRLNGGFILAFGYRPGAHQGSIPGKGVGYMPQEIALYRDLTVTENFNYFGKVMSMSSYEITERQDFLVDLLMLDREDKFVFQLSGGQQRRLSFAVALLHDPQLLVVDEPTVGVDSMLRKRIWEFLHKRSGEKNKTVIITTHYIEEARLAHVVGMMHDGEIVAESPPDDLMRKCQSPTLENAFYKICTMFERRHEAFRGKLDNAEFKDASTGTPSLEDLLRNTTYHDDVPAPPSGSGISLVSLVVPMSWNRVWALTVKYLKKLYRDQATFIICFIVPIAVVVLYCYVFQGLPKSIPVAVVNDDADDLAKLLLAGVNKDYIRQIPFNTMSEAEHSFDIADTYGILHIWPNFTDCLFERMAQGSLVSFETIETSRLHLKLHDSEPVISLTIYAKLNEALAGIARAFFNRLGLNFHQVEPLVVIDDHLYGPEEKLFVDLIAPGFFLCFTFIANMALTALQFLNERLDGQVFRCKSAGITAPELVLGFLLCCSTAMFIQVIAILFTAFTFLQVSCRGSYFLVFFLTILEGIFALQFGLAVGCIFESEFTALMFAAGMFFPIIYAGGVFWPIQGAHQYAQAIAVYLPVTLPAEAIRDVMSRGWGIFDYSVYMGVLVTVVWIAIMFVVASLAVKLKN